MQSPVGESREPTVVIVNGDTTVANKFAIWLGKTCTVKVARDRNTAYSLLDETVDVVVFERNVPEYSHLDVFSIIHHKGLDCQVAVVTDEEPAIDVIETGADEYLSKPVSEEKLCDSVGRLLAFTRYNEGIEELFRLTAIESQLETNLANRFTLNEQLARVKRRTDRLNEDLTKLAEKFSQTQFVAGVMQLSSDSNSEA